MNLVLVVYVSGYATTLSAIVCHIIGLIVLHSAKDTTQTLILKNFSVYSILSSIILSVRSVYIYQCRPDIDKMEIFYVWTNGIFIGCSLSYILLLFLLTIDRLVRFAAPHRYNATLSRIRIIRSLISIWLVYLCVSVVFVIYRNRKAQIYMYYIATVFTEIILLFIVISYLLIFYFVMKSSSKVQDTSESTKRRKMTYGPSLNEKLQKRRKHKSVYIALRIIIVMIIFYGIPNLTLVLLHTKLTYVWLAGVTMLSTSLGICLDGIVYIFFQGKMRFVLKQRLQKIIQGKRASVKHEPPVIVITP